jgi:hypothetical protein
MTQILNEVATYGPDMAATHFVQLDQRLLRSYLERWQALKKCSDLKDDMNQVRTIRILTTLPYRDPATLSSFFHVFGR